MQRKLLCLSAALLLLVGAHLRPVYRVTVDGQQMEGLYEPAMLSRALDAARAAVEEIASGEVRLPAVELHRRLSLRPGTGEAVVLSDAVLRAAEGVAAAEGVWINGNELGVVANGNVLLTELYEEIADGKPEGAAVGNLSGLLRIAPVYARPGTEMGEETMLRLITAAAPVFYVDWHGRIVMPEIEG